jgi:hypothetical protein
MNRKKTKNQIKELRSELKTANKASQIRLFKLALVLFIILIVLSLIYPNPIKDKFGQWAKKNLSISFLQ